jgi:hypothetical protein
MVNWIILNELKLDKCSFRIVLVSSDQTMSYQWQYNEGCHALLRIECTVHVHCPLSTELSTRNAGVSERGPQFYYTNSGAQILLKQRYEEANIHQ